MVTRDGVGLNIGNTRANGQSARTYGNDVSEDSGALSVIIGWLVFTTKPKGGCFY